jgi:MFS family permease
MQQKRKFYGWKMVGILWAVYFLMQGLVLYGEPVINTIMVIERGFTRTILGLGSSTFVLFQGFAAPFVARLIDKKGIRSTIVIGAALIAVSSLLMGFFVSKEWQYILCFGVLSGVGLGFGGMISVQSGVNYWFHERRAFAMSIALTGSGFGGFVAGNVFNGVIRAFDGNWRMGWHIITFTCLLTVCISLLWVKNKPEDLGQRPDDGYTPPEKHAAGPQRVFKTKGSVPFKTAIQMPKVWFVIITLVTIRFSYNICVSQGMIHLMDVGIPQQIAGLSVGTMTLFSVIGRFGAGVVGDRFEPRVIWIGGMLIFIAGILFLQYAATPWHAVAYSLCVGIGFGSSYVCSASLLANYFGADTFPLIMGVAIPAQMVIGALSPTMAGYFFDRTGSYNIPFTIALAAIVAGTASLCLARPPKTDLTAA